MAPLLFLSYCFFPTLYMNDVDRAVHMASRGSLDEHYDLIPRLFSGGEDRAAVSQRLSAAGWQSDQSENVDIDRYYKTPTPAAIGAALLVCSVTWGISTTFDAANSLVAAETSNTSACL